jgi:hypothetical protein
MRPSCVSRFEIWCPFPLMCWDEHTAGKSRAINGRRHGRQEHIMPTFVSTEDHVAAAAFSYVVSVELVMSTKDCRRRIETIQTLGVMLALIQPDYWKGEIAGDRPTPETYGSTKSEAEGCLDPRGGHDIRQCLRIHGFNLQSTNAEDQEQNLLLPYLHLQTSNDRYWK